MRLRLHHWLLFFVLALFAHLLLFLSQQEALLEPPKLQFRGGGLLDQGGDNPDSGGVLVTLGRIGDTPGRVGGSRRSWPLSLTIRCCWTGLTRRWPGSIWPPNLTKYGGKFMSF